MRCADLESLINAVFPDLHLRYANQGFMDGRAILTPKNVIVNSINDMIAVIVPGKENVFLSADTLHLNYVETVLLSKVESDTIGQTNRNVLDINGEVGVAAAVLLVYREAWKVLKLLTSNEEMENLMRSLNGVLAIDGYIRNNPSIFDWDTLLTQRALQNYCINLNWWSNLRCVVTGALMMVTVNLV
ncbi:hypothetical protein PsorP6_001397 [Peronosclerospora sorghi]|uniref:Uncharacterized protein n=1 Tax=Peronosclerospora sorghi TaxID=230839 RepID=A0ACC0WWN1_9STRA|nr:hypothetical protein PsorP6_001397 [Peronosclerospora sorghi]